MTTNKNAILLVAHGSREQIANREVHDLAERLKASSGIPHVIACFLEITTPTLAEGFQQALELGADDITVVPFFLASGLHATRDIPRILNECSQACPQVNVRITAAIGPDPGLDGIVLKRVHSAFHPNQGDQHA